MESKHDKRYVLPPPMVGFFEFTMMRVRNDVDQKVLSELFYQYLVIEEDFIKNLFDDCDMRFGRALVNESVLTTEQSSFVLDYERATHIIETSHDIGVSMCYCRHVKQHLGTNCDTPLELCLSFNSSATTLIKHEYAKRIDKSEAIEKLHEGYERNLVQFGENARKDISFICNCCGCCCEALNAAKNFGNLHPIETSNFQPTLNEDTCISCGKCAKSCPIEVINMSNKDNGKSIPLIDQNFCLGCGVCARVCPNKSITLRQRDIKVITPVNSVHRTVVMAIEKGKLPDLIFDNKALFSHRALAAILSAILKLTPIQKLLASKQLKSVYLDKLLSKTSI